MKRKREKVIIIVGLLVSILVHLTLLLFTPIKFAQASKDTMMNSLPSTIKAFLAEPPSRLNSDKEKMSIVDLMDDSKVNPAKPNNSKYLSDKDRTVEKETKAKNPTNIPTSAEVMHKGSSGKNEKEDGEKKSKDDTKNADASGVLYSQRIQEKSGQEGDEAIDLYPDLGKQLPSNRPYDPNYLEGLEEGEKTQLNTREFLYSSYFTRIKRQISSHWDPQKAFQEMTKKNSSPRHDMIAEVTITIDRAGNLRGLDIAKSSGEEAWDQESLHSIRSAAPFRNPPPEMFGKNDLYTFNFGFIGSLDSNFFYKRIERMY